MGSMFVQLKEGLATAGSGLLAYDTSAYPIDECVPFVVGVDGRHFLWSQRLLLTWVGSVSGSPKLTDLQWGQKMWQGCLPHVW